VGFCGRVHTICVNLRVDASPLEFSMFDCPRSGRGLRAKCPRHCPACWPWPCPVRIRVRSQSRPASWPCPWSVRARVQSATVTVVCPWPRTVHFRDVSANISVSSPGIDRDPDFSASSPWPCPLHIRAQSESEVIPRSAPSRVSPFPRFIQEKSKLVLDDFYRPDKISRFQFLIAFSVVDFLIYSTK
jgi:hypothetical protein